MRLAASGMQNGTDIFRLEALKILPQTFELQLDLKPAAAGRYKRSEGIHRGIQDGAHQKVRFNACDFYSARTFYSLSLDAAVPCLLEHQRTPRSRLSKDEVRRSKGVPLRQTRFPLRSCYVRSFLLRS